MMKIILWQLPLASFVWAATTSTHLLSISVVAGVEAQTAEAAVIITQLEEVDLSSSVPVGALATTFSLPTTNGTTGTGAGDTVRQTSFLQLKASHKERWIGCDDYERVWDEYECIVYFYTLHQGLDIYYDEESDDACLFLHDYLHMCASNRPHYHEVFTHYPAHFLETVERVLFIGGGDSMVLHEVLKYPSLELVVGLELDQQVVRTTFQYFGAQPHWDDERVQWYFGDGAKSLNVLPREYYGTFDLVVVDILSPLAEALKVNEELTVMEASMLLLKPDGIIIKNEDEGFEPGRNTANFTKYSVDIMFHDVPIYCLQTFVIGSNTKNFLHATPTDHNVTNLYLKGGDEFQSQFDAYYNSNERYLTDSLCRREKNQDATAAEEEKLEVQDTERFMVVTTGHSPGGVDMIIEAEQTSEPLEDMLNVQEKLRTTLGRLGFLVNHSKSSKLVKGAFHGYVLTFLLDQGYVMARCVAALQFCAFDVQLWADIHKLTAVKTALVAVVGSTQVSEFRVVTSGMVDAKNEQPDKVGPPSIREYCESQEEQIDPTFSSPSKVKKVEEKLATFVLATAPIEDREFLNATLHSYDHSSAQKQWMSQRSIGQQTIQQYEAQHDKTVDVKWVEHLVRRAISQTGAHVAGSSPDGPGIEQFAVAGDGSVSLASWSTGHVVIVWNGACRVDLNWFMFGVEEDVTDNMMDLTLEAMRRILQLKLIVKDEFPRGTGRVINFFDEYQRRNEEKPNWF